MLSKERLQTLLSIGFTLSGIALFYFWQSLLFNIYASAFTGLLGTYAWGIPLSLFAIYLLKKKWSFSQDFWQSLGVILINSIFGVAIIRLASRYSTLFHRYMFCVDHWFPFVLLGLVDLMVLLIAFRVYQRFALPAWLKAPRRFVDEHLWGLTLAGIFFVTYFVLAIIFNRTEFYMIDSLFEGDHSYWLKFFGVDAVGGLSKIRAVHPLVYIFLRPLSWVLSLFVNGNAYYGALLAIAGMGAFAVFLFWLFLYEHGLPQPTTLLFASIFGASTTHLLFGAFAESYIFSAATILLFFVLVQRKNTTLKSLVPAGLLVFGITISNIVQTVTALFFVRKNFKLVIRYLVILLVLAVLLTFVNNALYPHESSYFFIPDQLLGEQKYAQPVLDFPEWKLRGRIYTTVRSLVLYNIVAPSSFFTLPEPGKPLPRISFFAFKPGTFFHSAYDGSGNFVLLMWLLLLGLAGIHFLWRLRKRQHWQQPNTLFSLALLANIAFNLLFHIVYGEDPFLYSADWTYALLLFVGINTISRWWSKTYLLIFLILMMVNNFIFLDKLIAVLAQAF